jgi:hypothetical protein
MAEVITLINSILLSVSQLGLSYTGRKIELPFLYNNPSGRALGTYRSHADFNALYESPSIRNIAKWRLEDLDSFLPRNSTDRTIVLSAFYRVSRGESVDRDSSVGIVPYYRLDGQRIESWWGRDFPHPSRRP